MSITICFSLVYQQDWVLVGQNNFLLSLSMDNIDSFFLMLIENQLKSNKFKTATRLGQTL